LNDSHTTDRVLLQNHKLIVSLTMSEQQFNDAWTDFTAKAKAYNSVQRTDLLQSVKDGLAAALTKAGQARPEPLDTQQSVSAVAPASKESKDSKMDPSSLPAAGSVTGSRPSTRVVAPAGGTTSIVLGGAEEKHPISAKKHLQNSNQSSFSLGVDESHTPQSSMSGVRIQKAPGGTSSIVFGDDSNPAPPDPHEKRPRTAAAAATASAQAALAGSSPATPSNAEHDKPSTSVKVVQAPGGKSNISLGEEPKSTVGSDVVPLAVRKEISDAVYRKAKLKDTFTKFTGNRTKTLSAADFRSGLSTIGVNITEVQAAALVKEFAKDPEGLSHADFVRLLSLS
jgi:hypothetical protein